MKEGRKAGRKEGRKEGREDTWLGEKESVRVKVGGR